MFIQLTELCFNVSRNSSPTETELFVQSDQILTMEPRGDSYTPKHTRLCVGTNHWPYVKETPKEIMLLAGQHWIPGYTKKENNAQDTNQSA